MNPQIAEIVASAGVTGEQGQLLAAHLTEREDKIADALRNAGAQFGAMPELVAEVIASLGMGTPPDEVTRAFIRQQFIDTMERLRQQFGDQQ